MSHTLAVFVSTSKELPGTGEPPADPMQAADSAQPAVNTTRDAKDSIHADHDNTQDENDDTLTQAIEKEMDTYESELAEGHKLNDTDHEKTKIEESMSKIEENQKDRVDVDFPCAM